MSNATPQKDPFCFEGLGSFAGFITQAETWPVRGDTLYTSCMGEGWPPGRFVAF